MPAAIRPLATRGHLVGELLRSVTSLPLRRRRGGAARRGRAAERRCRTRSRRCCVCVEGGDVAGDVQLAHSSGVLSRQRIRRRTRRGRRTARRHGSPSPAQRDRASRAWHPGARARRSTSSTRPGSASRPAHGRARSSPSRRTGAAGGRISTCTVDEWRGEKGVRWIVRVGARRRRLAGSMEIWLRAGRRRRGRALLPAAGRAPARPLRRRDAGADRADDYRRRGPSGRSGRSPTSSTRAGWPGVAGPRDVGRR